MIFTPNWVLATSCKIKAPGNDFFWISNENVPKLGPQWQGAEVPKTSLFLIGLLVFPAPQLVFPAPHLFFPNGAKMDPKMVPGDPIIRVFKPKTATQICATIGTVSTLKVASCLLLACFLPPCSPPASLLSCCFNPTQDKRLHLLQS